MCLTIFMRNQGVLSHICQSVEPVVIAGLGVVCPLGRNVTEVSRRMFRGDQRGFIRSSEFIPGRECFVGAVGGDLPECPAGFAGMWSRNTALSLVAMEQIEELVRECRARFGQERIGVVLGSSTSGIAEGERAVREQLAGFPKPGGYFYAQQQMGTVSDFVSRYFGLTGPSYTISTACSSSAKVFRSGSMLLQCGLCDAVIVGGIDSLCGLTLNGFSALELVSDRITNPFSKNRTGITIGEGGALFLLLRAADSPGSKLRVAGVGESSDAYHISSPDPSGDGAVAAISRALAEADIQPHEVDYINLHGTGTMHNDAMEAIAIQRVFPEGIPCSSTKPLVGHMLGASGAIEVAFCSMALEDSEGRIPPHCWDGESDPDLPSLPLVSVGQHFLQTPRIALSNSFGFGGSNCAVVVTRDV